MTRVRDVIDKGPDRGALVFTEREVRDKASGELLCRLSSTTFLRGDGGFGGPADGVPAPHPSRTALQTKAAIWRRCLRRRSSTASPATAIRSMPIRRWRRRGGFPRPILHGLCTFGIAGHALLRTVCDYKPERLRSLQGRFTAPVFPGETIVTEIWRDDAIVSFRASAKERGKVVLDHGRATIVD